MSRPARSSDFQHFNLLSSRTVRGNVELGLEIATVGSKERTKRSSEILDLFPLGPVEPRSGGTVIDITFSGGTADRPVISQLSRTHGLDVSILCAVIETIAGKQAGRTRPELPGSPGENDAAIDDLENGAKIAIPNDPTNEGRALGLLASLRPGHPDRGR
jgi:ABC-type methionine transport system ATPase subunit